MLHQERDVKWLRWQRESAEGSEEIDGNDSVLVKPVRTEPMTYAAPAVPEMKPTNIKANIFLSKRNNA